MVGWVSGADIVGIDPGPAGGAKFSAGPDGASGTDAGGTGGGRSLNNWAGAGFDVRPVRPAASKSAARTCALRPHLPIPFPLQIMAMLFTENAANSSLKTPAIANSSRPNPRNTQC